MLKIFAVLVAVQAALGSTLVTHQLERALHQNNVANIFVTLKEDTSQVLATISNTRFVDRGAKLNALNSALRQHADQTQEPITSFLSSQPQTFEMRSFWISNQIYIKNADSQLVSQLAEKFSDLISSIDEEFFAHLIQPVSVKTNVSRGNRETEWGVVKIQAPEAWKELGGISKAGEGVVIATVDTGVRGTHEALRDNFVGEYGWHDPSGQSPNTPTDNNGHGTHTT